MLSIQNLSFHYGSRALYDEASLHIKPKTRTALIGMNGTGKSTLLKLINGDLTPDGGLISKRNDCSIGFLNQDLLSFESEESILHVAMQAFERQLYLQKQIEEILVKMETDHSEEIINKLAKLQDEFETLEGYSIQAKAEEILEGLGFETDALSRPLKNFSGGWRMRVMLAKLLLQKPGLLMLDEPTNHLDMPSIQWLENYLESYEGAVIIVSHDRAFLDRAANNTVEVISGKLIQYSGNYSFYLEEKELRNEVQRNAFKNQQQKIKQTERFVERFKSKATKASQAQSRVKMLEKMDRVEEVVDDNVQLNIKFTFKQQPGKIITTLKNASKSYGDLKILKNTNAQIMRGDKIAFIGANGKGKSTVLRMIAGTESFDGIREPGHNVIPSFYAQHQLEALHLENEILQELKESGAEKTELELRSILGCFLFRGDDVFKKIKVLSGGEKSRVALSKTLISQANFLLLDEPTNHLDMQSVNILVQAIQGYDGTCITVSHDRHFVSQIANKIWYIEDMQVKEYPGTYDEFNTWMAERDEQKELAKLVAQKEVKSNKKDKKNSWKTDDATAKELKKLKRELSAVEDRIMKLEEKKEAFEEEMAKPEVFAEPFKLAEATEKYERVKAELEKVNEEWEELAEKVDELEG
ncbi:ABC-F family ATP-binding cassette domain-containing protein [Flammeovirgaceae bacterium SG7u.111]|nr:ABC-F family ATP-binding cassette domain-containing protein [Flammeovirgaceae bacterium SG7u.132]WPO37180.1 ABC-F family ATP-binding cassette domain-containing protein [Flammeovirgaceae bacterium SG7u.111]